ncbi:hypothetical protein Y032_0656g1219 [Ancylostoma ceylanicum]|uniref:Uncharacterized protein n=1 Tax=Ancylostoma ceylanicum TaxID=53326 RepID=A0A016WI05_9BILA|nr:hypothetical protein Y032_0656g1219 [Ancylostoma ceylanicum]
MTVDSEFHTRIHPSDGPRLADCSAGDSTKTSIAAFVDVKPQDIRLATFGANCHGAPRGEKCGKPAQEHPYRVDKPAIRDGPISKRHLRRVQLRKERSKLRAGRCEEAGAAERRHRVGDRLYPGGVRIGRRDLQ